MAKKGSFLGRETRNLSDLISGSKTIQEETRQAILGLENNPGTETLTTAVETVRKDPGLLPEERESLLHAIDEMFLTLIDQSDFDHLDLETVENEIHFLKNKGRQVVYLIGKRLNYLHDLFENKKGEKFIRLREYKTFENYMQEKFHIARQTGYQYMGIAKYYDVCAHRQIDHSKLVPFLSIIKDIERSEMEDKDELKTQIISESIRIVESHSFREVKVIVGQKKKQLGFSFAGHRQENRVRRFAESLMKKIPGDLNEAEKESVLGLISELEKRLR